MRKRTAMGALMLATVLLLAGLLAWWLAPAPPPAEREDVPDPDVLQTVQDFDEPTDEPSEGPAPTEAPEPRDETAVAEALTALAAAEGHGRVACPLPPGIGDVEVRHRHQERIGDVLHFTVAEAAGSINVHEANRAPDCIGIRTLTAEWSRCNEAQQEAMADTRIPLGRFEWSDAWPGERGTCRYLPVEIIEMRGTLAFAGDQANPSNLSVSSCLGDGALDGEGGFVVEAVRGQPCSVHGFAMQMDLAMQTDGEHPTIITGHVELEAAEPRTDLVVTLAPDDALSNPSDFDLNEVIDAERTRPNALEVALDTEGLSPEAREVLQGWRNEELDQLDDMADMAEDVQDMMNRLEDLQDRIEAGGEITPEDLDELMPR